MQNETIIKAIAQLEGQVAVVREEIIEFVNKYPDILTSMIISYTMVPRVNLADVDPNNDKAKIAALAESMTFAQMLQIVLENHNRITENENLDN